MKKDNIELKNKITSSAMTNILELLSGQDLDDIHPLYKYLSDPNFITAVKNITNDVMRHIDAYQKTTETGNS